ncbi:MAG: phosphopantothenoylcysteine decarboxylase [bacterium]
MAEKCHLVKHHPHVLHVLITAGPTREYIDTVRFITNASSGIMAREIAAVFLKKKYEIRIISGPVSVKFPGGSRVIPVLTASEMYEKVKDNFKWADILFFAAAPCDWKPSARSPVKMRKKKRCKLCLKSTVDIAKRVLRGKSFRVSVGFALEDDLDVPAALKKKAEKKFDFIVLNRRDAISNIETTGFILGDGTALMFNEISKKNLAEILWEVVCKGKN